MVQITEELVRRRAEHNDGFISTLEELSLHQLSIERIEHLDRWCPRLKILYLQGNLIPRIENVSRLKYLTYLNLALNNICLIENLAGCESLTKLDLTVNFICKLSSVSELKENYNLRELYLMGNPCASFTYYHQYVITILRQLQCLDGKLIKISDRILALQNFDVTQSGILEQEAMLEKDRHYKTLDRMTMTADESFWTENSSHTVESRLELHRRLQQAKDIENSSRHSIKREEILDRRLSNKDGRILNINEPKVDFKFCEVDDCLLLEVAVYKYLDTSLIHVDVQPRFVQIFIKKKLLQLVLESEVKPDRSNIQRSLTTGHLIIRMQKMDDEAMIGVTKNRLCHKDPIDSNLNSYV